MTRQQGSIRMGLWTVALLAVTLGAAGGRVPSAWAQAPLTNGVPVGSTVAHLTFAHFSLVVPSGATLLTVTTTNASGDVGLYVRRDPGDHLLPELDLFDCRPFSVSGNETCQFENPQAGTWFISVHGFDPGTLSFTVTATYQTGTVPDIAGTYQGSGTLTATNCGDPPQTQVFPFEGVVLTITQTGSAFQGTGSFVQDFGGFHVQGDVTLTGTVTADGHLSGQSSLTLILNGQPISRPPATFTGTFANNTITISGTNPFTDGGPSCTLTTALTGTRSSGPPPILVASVLPLSRSVQAGSPATAFATILNAGPGTATGCSITPSTTPLSATFVYQTTDPTTNALTGTPNTPVDIAAGIAQSFVIAFTPTAVFRTSDVQLTFDCTNTAPVSTIVGVNTLLLAASATPVPDIVALAATIGNTGIVTLASVGVFAVATVNVGAGGLITASADTGAATLPVTLALCQTNPTTGECISDLGATVTTQINTGATPTFGIFVTGTPPIPLDPATNRIFVRFKDGGGVTRGATSVAVRTQ